MGNIIIILVVASVVIVTGLYVGGVFNPKNTSSPPSSSSPSPPPPPSPSPSPPPPPPPPHKKDISTYITPQPFKTGYLSNIPQKNANLCGNDSIIQPQYVDYGYWDEDSYNRCDNLIFNMPP